MVIDQAQGLLMAPHKISSKGSFALLTRLSQHSNTKLRDIAVLLVAEVDAGLLCDVGSTGRGRTAAAAADPSHRTAPANAEERAGRSSAASGGGRESTRP